MLIRKKTFPGLKNSALNLKSKMINLKNSTQTGLANDSNGKKTLIICYFTCFFK